MRRSSILAGTLMLVTLFAASGPALASDAQKGLLRNILVVFVPPSPEEQQRISSAVGLSDDQRAQMKAVNDRYRADAQNLRGKYQTAYSDVVRLMQATSPDKSTVNAKLKRFHSVHQEVVNHEVRYWMDFKSILTPEQNKKFWNVFEQSRVRG